MPVSTVLMTISRARRVAGALRRPMWKRRVIKQTQRQNRGAKRLARLLRKAVVVIGAGIAGLRPCGHPAAAGLRTVLEQNETVGGKMRGARTRAVSAASVGTPALGHHHAAWLATCLLRRAAASRTT